MWRGRQWEIWEFAPYASNSPTSWAVNQLPPGMSLDVVTGKVSGAATRPGIYECEFKATNADGTSAPVLFTFGIETGGTTASPDVDVTIDLITRVAALSDAKPLPSAVAAPLPASEVLNTAKAGDDLIYRVRFVKNGVPVALEVTELKVTIKEFDGEGVIAESTTGFAAVGSGVEAAYRVHILVGGSGVESALSDFEDDEGTEFRARLEFEWKCGNPDYPGFGPATLRGTSATGRLLIAKPQEEE